MFNFRRNAKKKKPALLLSQRSLQGFLIGVFIVAVLIIGFSTASFSALADGGGWPTATFVIFPTIADFPTATLFPTVDLSELNRLVIEEATPTATVFVVPTAEQAGRSLNYLCAPLAVGFILISILALLIIMRRRQV